MALTDILTRRYNNFMGVDFRGGEVSYYHSPDALNMWRDYTDSDCIQTRPGMRLLGDFDNSIFGLFFYKINNNIQVLVHSGTKLYRWNNFPTSPANTTELYSGLSPSYSRCFIFDNIFFLLDGAHYIEYNGTTCQDVEGTIPMTSYLMNPDGSTDMDMNSNYSSADGDLIYQVPNLLTAKEQNQFKSDGISLTYQLNEQNLDTTFIVQCHYIDRANDPTGTVIELDENVDFTVDRTAGKVTFNQIIPADAYVYFLFKINNADYLRRREKILNSTINCEFDNRIFFSGNGDYPNAIFWSEENDPRYVTEINYNEIGIDLAPIKTIIPGNNVLWAIKEINQYNASVYYMTPSLNEQLNKIYPVVNGNIAVGCVSTGINFNDDIVFFSKLGLEAIGSSSMYSEQILKHRSTYVDTRLTNETNYEDVKLIEHNGYLMCLVDSKIYLADSRKMVNTGAGINEYEWYYWSLPNDIKYITEYRGIVYLANNDGEIYELSGNVDETTDNNQEVITPIVGNKYYKINSYWTTGKDDFGYPSYTKTTNKKGGEVTLRPMNNNNITISTIPDGTLKTTKLLTDTKGYGVFKIKNKKFYKMQLRVQSDEPFGLYQIVLQGFIAGYLKR